MRICHRYCLTLLCALTLVTVLAGCFKSAEPNLAPATLPAPAADLSDDFLLPPVAPALVVSAAPGVLLFDWSDLAAASTAELLSYNTDTRLYNHVATARPASTHIELPVEAHLTDWAHTQYLIEVCDATDCVRSRTVPVNHLLAAMFREIAPVNARAFDLVGTSVAMTNNGRILVTGAEGSDAAGLIDAGAAYVQFRVGDQWWHDAKLEANTPVAEGLLGHTVAISEDGNTIIAGAPGDPLADIHRGSVLVFDRFGEGWQQSAQLFPESNGGSADKLHFGTAVALSVDGNTVFVGAPLDNNIETGTDAATELSDRVWIYQRVDHQWRLLQALSAPAGSSLSAFGHSLTSADNGNRLFVSDPTVGVISQFDRNNGQYQLMAQIPMSVDHSNIEIQSLVANIEGTLLITGVLFRSAGSGGVSDLHTFQGQIRIYQPDTSGAWQMVQLLIPAGEHSSRTRLRVDSSDHAGVIAVGLSNPDSRDNRLSTFISQPLDNQSPVWKLQSVISNPDNTNNGFTEAVTVSGDGKNVGVGVPMQPGRAAGAAVGTVYIY